MSLLSRAFAPAARHDLADLVTRLLSTLDTTAPGQAAPSRLPDPAEHPPTARRVLPGPTGIGTSAARITARDDAPSRGRGGSAVPSLYCPPVFRDDPALGEEVNDRLIAWAERVGIYADRLDSLRATDLGRMTMLCHPDTDDPDRLLAAAKCATAEWATDDAYCDDPTAGAAPDLIGPRLALASAAVDLAHLPLRYGPDLDRAMRADPVLVALRSSVSHLSDYAADSQLHRLSHEIAGLFLGYEAEAGWRVAGRIPPVWEYLTARQLNSFLPCLAVIDAVGGYELPTAVYAQPSVRRAVKLAALASTLVNDLYSMAKEGRGNGLDFSLPTVIAAEDGCSPQQAVERAAAVHDELVHTFEAEAAVLSAAGPPQLRRFLTGVWAWLGGNREWHHTSQRYRGA
ncbi:family 2 encapsulin nanocompartment cargo protein terpene cyclase [Catellatospora sp. KI3]|uniref:family 2 encapsulin nanocompartment cargo protein terpene cyclase n=1 Tax=Catellatospora sp. KI3 TaxID=3041620 RepID=UPI0024821357|nr:family 2 encapsulin nanocompartment cargo protein terpene cyclase [Catellatospora sp. KI3]MDI1460882.1 family 2 encapsulin nanocompartment cargo protein terpene cyclase [Catellatospora sp. KI3]